MKLPVFELEAYLGEREFSTEIMFSGSDVESMGMAELLAMADPELTNLWNSMRLHYTEPKGHPLLLEALGKSYGLSDPQGKLCTFAGAEEAIYTAMQVLLQPEDHVVTVVPGYQSLAEIPRSLAGLTEVQLRFEAGKASLDADEIRKAIRPNTKMLVINFPHNPTGTTISHECQNQLIEMARRQGIYLFSDEVYRGLEHRPEDQLPAIASVYEKGISLGVMSKPYGLAGIRIGWLATQEPGLVSEFERFKYYLSICNSAPSEILAMIALRNRDAILTKHLNLVRSNLESLSEFFELRSDIFEWLPPQGGCTAFPRLMLPQSTYEFAEDFRNREGVLLLPGTVFGDRDNRFRVSYGRANMPEALRRLARYLERSGAR